MAYHAVTGGAGFIAVTLIRRLLERGHDVLAIDDLSRGRREHWNEFQDNPRFRCSVVDCANLGEFQRLIQTAHARSPLTNMWHLAANSDIPAGIADPTIDLTNTFLTTFNVLMIMKEYRIPALHFASSSAIYGDLGDIALHEAIGPIEPISNYGAMKLASEAQIRASVESYLPRADIFRFPNVVGAPATHGIILDLVRKLQSTPQQLDVLGNGTQLKAYLHVEELVEGMLFIVDHAAGRYNVFNIGPSDDGIFVRDIARLVRDRVSPEASIEFGEGERGWVGDVPRFRYDTTRLANLGWRPQLSSHDAIVRAVEEIYTQEFH